MGNFLRRQNKSPKQGALDLVNSHVIVGDHLSISVITGFTTGEAVTSKVGSEVKCAMQKTVQEERYFRKLSSKKNDLRERNKIIYAEFPFYRTTWVLGWTMRGKRGPLRGEDTERPGIITEYVMLFLNHEGKWNFINNTKTGKEVFWNEGNLASPDTITKVRLATPLQTNMLRIFPQLWDGVPYVRININYCQEPDPTAPASLPPKGKVSSIESTWDDKKIKSDEVNPSQKTSLERGGIQKTTQNSPHHQTGIKKAKTMTSEKKWAERNLEKEQEEHKENNKNSKRPSKPGDIDFAKLFSSKIMNSNVLDQEGTRKNSRMHTESPRNKGVIGNGRTHNKNSPLYNNVQTASPKFKDKYESEMKTSEISQLSSQHRKKLRPQNINVSKSMTSSTLQGIGVKIEKVAMITNNASLKKYDTKRLECSSGSPHWRYKNSNSKHTNDVFISAVDMFQAWRAMNGISTIPFQFPISNDKPPTERNLQVSFKSPQKIIAIQVHGWRGNAVGRWGVVTKFSLLHKLGNQRWQYYKDRKSKPGVFDMGRRQRSNVVMPVIFRLPVPVKATDIRMIPEKWSGLPFISLDFLTCDLNSQNRKGEKCWKPLLGKTGHMQRVEFRHLSKKRFFRNKKFKEVSFAHKVPALVKAIEVSKRPTEENNNRSLVTRFVLQYMNTNGRWTNVVDKKGYVKVFKVNKKKKLITFTSPVEALSIRIFPQKWTGQNPEMMIDFKGCHRQYIQ